MLIRASATVASQDDLFAEEVSPPPRPTGRQRQGTGQCDASAGRTCHSDPLRLKPFTVRRVGGFETILKSGETLKILSAKTATQLDADLVLLVPDACARKTLATRWSAAKAAGSGRRRSIPRR